MELIYYLEKSMPLWSAPLLCRAAGA